MSVEIAAIGVQRPFVLEALEQEFTVHKVWEEADRIAAVRPVADRVRGAITNAMSGLSADMIEALPNLEICAIMGVGLETTDLKAARERGIVVTTTPVLYDDVADLGVILALCACRRIVEADRFVRAGRWLQGRIAPAHKFSGKRAGILGLGRIGTALAPRLQAFGLSIGYYDPAAQAGRSLPGLRFAARARAQLRHPVPLRRRRSRGAATSSPPRSWTRSARRAFSSTSRAAGWSTRRRWCVRSRKAGSAPRVSTCSSTSRRCRKRCSASTTWC